MSGRPTKRQKFVQESEPDPPKPLKSALKQPKQNNVAPQASTSRGKNLVHSAAVKHPTKKTNSVTISKVEKSKTVSNGLSRIGSKINKSTSNASTSTSPFNFKVIAGSYEKILYGLHVEVSPPNISKDSGKMDEEEIRIKPAFIFPAHISCVKAVAASPSGGKWLATGGTDETVKVWDLRRKREMGSLNQHQGSITHLSFPTKSHLLSASEDGTICLYHTRDWAHLATLKGHKERVNAVAVHPSAKAALSVGKDRTLRMWDLMRGKGSASTKLGAEGEVVRWTHLGHKFAVVIGSNIDIYSTKMVLLERISHPSRIHDIRFVSREDDRDLVLVAAEDKRTAIYLLRGSNDETSNLQPSPIIGYLIGHQNRVKAIDIIRSSSTWFLGSASSDGKIHIYDLHSILRPPFSTDVMEISPIGVYDTKGTRLTCLTLAEEPSAPGLIEFSNKRKRRSGDEQELAMSEDETGSEGDSAGGSDEEGEENEEEEEEEEEEEDEDEEEME